MLVTEKPSISWSAIEKITDGRGLIMRYLALLLSLQLHVNAVIIE